MMKNYVRHNVDLLQIRHRVARGGNRSVCGDLQARLLLRHVDVVHTQLISSEDRLFTIGPRDYAGGGSFSRRVLCLHPGHDRTLVHPRIDDRNSFLSLSFSSV